MKASRTTSQLDLAPAGPRGVSRGAALASGAALFLLIMLVYAGASWAIALYRMLTDGVVVVLWLGAAVGVGLTVHSALAVDRDAGVASTGVIAAALGLGIISLAVLGLGLKGLVGAITGWSIVAVGLLLLVLRALARRGAVEAWLRERAGWCWLWLLIAPFVALAVVAALMPPGVLWSPDDPHPYDVVEYHFQIPREWYEAGRIIPLEHNVFSYFPFNVEMQYLLAMHLRGGPWAGMYVAQLMHVAYVVLAVLAVYAMTRQWAGRGGAMLAALATAAAPWLWVLAPVGYNEGGLLLYGALAIGLAIDALRGDAAPVRRLALAGAMAGFACGVKLTAAPLLLAGVPFAMLFTMLITGRTRALALWKGLAAFVLIGLVTFSPWLVRNMVWIGNPVFPEAQGVFGHGHFTAVQSQRWAQAHAPAEERASVGGRLAAARDQIVFDWRYAFVLLPLGLAAVAIDRSGRAIFLLAMLAINSVFWIGFTHLQSRFFVLVIPLAAMLIGSPQRWRQVTAGVLAFVMLVSLARLHLRLSSYLYGSNQLITALGVGTLEWAKPEALQDVPADVPVTLAGDARAFLYDIPMSRLSYRTVFDVDVREGEDLIDAWTRGSRPNAVIVVDPTELRRFADDQTGYYGISAPSPEVLSRDRPFILERQD